MLLIFYRDRSTASYEFYADLHLDADCLSFSFIDVDGSINDISVPFSKIYTFSFVA